MFHIKNNVIEYLKEMLYTNILMRKMILIWMIYPTHHLQFLHPTVMCVAISTHSVLFTVKQKQKN